MTVHSTNELFLCSAKNRLVASTVGVIDNAFRWLARRYSMGHGLTPFRHGCKSLEQPLERVLLLRPLAINPEFLAILPRTIDLIAGNWIGKAEVTASRPEKMSKPRPLVANETPTGEPRLAGYLCSHLAP